MLLKIKQEIISRKCCSFLVPFSLHNEFNARIKMKYGKLQNSQICKGDSRTKADGIAKGSQIYFNPYNEVAFKQCHILLNSSQGFQRLFRHCSYSNRDPNNSVLNTTWLCWVFFTVGIQLWSNVEVTALLRRCNTHTAGPNQAAKEPEEIRAVGAGGNTDEVRSNASPTPQREEINCTDTKWRLEIGVSSPIKASNINPFYCVLYWNVLWLLMHVDATLVTRKCEAVFLQWKCINGWGISALVSCSKGHCSRSAVMAHWHYFQQWTRQRLVFISWEKVLIHILIEQTEGQADR